MLSNAVSETSGVILLDIESVSMRSRIGWSHGLSAAGVKTDSRVFTTDLDSV